MKLGELLTALESSMDLPPDRLEREVPDISHDSRSVQPGSLFVAVRGFHSDGHRFIPQALERGAAVIVAEDLAGADTAGPAVLIRVRDSRAALARLATRFYGRPSEKLRLIGITGTKGKTTTSYLVRSIIEAAGHTSGLIGTIDYRIGSRVYPAPNTTPESLELQKLLAEMVAAKAGYAVMEVSSHALALGRTEGCVFDTAVFTNLQQDHLDFHKDLRSYFQAKLLLLSGLAGNSHAVVNADDPNAAEVLRSTKAAALTFGMTDAADIAPIGKIGHNLSGLVFTVRTPRGPVAVASPLVGRHNVYNILSAIGVGVARGFSSDAIEQGIRNMRAVPGRMEKVDEGQLFGVVVDYAHTEASLASLLEAVRDMATARIITVFGCGGERDRTKRPRMGAAAAAGSDIVIVTSDNPRSEDPLNIIREIESGMAASAVRVSGPDAGRSAIADRTPYYVMPDRREAVSAAIGMARPGDVVVLAGKGHEDYQVIGEQKLPFDDREVARAEIRKCGVACGVRHKG